MASLSGPLGSATPVPSDQTSSPPVSDAGSDQPMQTAEVPVRSSGGTFVVPVLINGIITLDFLIDSGASDVSIPADVVLTLMRAGTISKDDFLGTQTYTLADGTTVPSQTFTLHSLKLGDVVINDVVASMGSPEGTLLLGQSFLSHFQKWSIDNKRQLLVLN
jgi:clan AA aspartic protease (TIGR02281 family)